MDLSLPRLLHPWDFPGKSTAVGCHFLLQGIFLTQQSNAGLLPCRQMLFHLSHRKVLNLIPKIVLKLRLTHNKFYMASSQIKDVLLWKTTIYLLITCYYEGHLRWEGSLMLSYVQLFVTVWTVAHQASLSLEFSRQEYCSGLPYPLPGDLPNPGIKARSPTLQADSLLSEPPDFS